MTQLIDTKKPENLDKPVRVTRKCLSCAKPFESIGPGNRICRRCKSTDAFRETTLGDGEYTRHR